MERVDERSTNSVLKFQGLSTETKPTLIQLNSGSTFYCVDTGDLYTWHIDRWYPV